MKAKTAKAHLKREFDKFAASITDETVRLAVKRDGMITGGAIASLLLAEPVNDYDVYFRTRETTAMVAQYYVDQFLRENESLKFWDGSEVSITVDVSKEDRISTFVKSAGVAVASGSENYEYFEADPSADATRATEYVSATAKALSKAKGNTAKGKYAPVFLSSNAITLSDDFQIITRFYGEPDEIHQNYDFVHTTSYWTSRENVLTLPPAALEALLARELRYVGSKYPLCSMIRVRKFVQRDWTITAGCLLKIAWQINALDLTDLSVLQEQLTGVDMAYFGEIITKLSRKGNVPVDGAFLFELIDELF